MAEYSEKDELLQTWANALRSGEYKQLNAFKLREMSGECIFYSPAGVLCDLYDNTRWIGESYWELHRRKSWHCHLPNDLDLLLGTSNFVFSHSGKLLKPFKIIAKWVEDELLTGE